MTAIEANHHDITIAFYDLTGKCILQETAPVEVSPEETIDMDAYWDKVADLMKGMLIKSCLSANNIAAVGITGGADGLWAIDGQGKPVCEAIAGNSDYGEAEAYTINVGTPGVGKLMHRNVGCSATKGCAAVLLRRLKAEDPETYQKIDKIFFAKDWVRYQLTGEIATDLTDGGTAFLRFANGGVPMQLLTVLGISEVTEKLPNVLPSASIAGHLTPEAAARTGLTTGLQVCTGAGWFLCNAYGAGVFMPGAVILHIDDHMTLGIVRKKIACDPGRTGRHYFNGLYPDSAMELISGANGKDNLDWAFACFNEKQEDPAPICKNTKKEFSIEEAIAAVPAGAEGILFHPFNTPGSSRNVIHNQDAAGVFFGVTPATTQTVMLRAVYESIAFTAKDLVEAADLPADKGIILTGDPRILSGVLPQIIADVCERPVMVPNSDHPATKGAAMLAGIAAGFYDDLIDGAKQCLDPGRICKPKSDPVYQQMYQLYRELRRSCVPLWQSRKNITRL